MPVRMIREKDVRALVTMADALEAVEGSLVEQANGTGVNEPRRRVRQPNGLLHLLGGALVRRGYWGFKAYTTTRQGTRFTMNLYDVQTGKMLALIEADYIGQLRTGAASGVATKYLARPDSRTLALFGSGFQAEGQLEAIAAVHQLQDVRVYSRTASKREAFAEQMGQRFGLAVRAVATPSEALNGADIVTTITTSTEPVFNGDDLSAGMHINGAGSNSVIRAELDRTTIRRVDQIFTDDLETARIESGNLVQAYEKNALNWTRVRLLADVVAGRVAGRRRPEEITLFESHGIALWDVALAATVFERAQAADVGTMVKFAEMEEAG